METKELFTLITSQLKWYMGYCTADYATKLKQRFEANQLSEKKLAHLFKHFGYIKAPSTWEHVDGAAH